MPFIYVLIEVHGFSFLHKVRELLSENLGLYFALNAFSGPV